ncbi:calcium-binding allergen Ole e 8-like [Telopea speciosissima]|uniref:calcium-binding allergen Ole e 8-like n=1 Tax=Telopea speciosissima TaxID=54955 RepID=UPI001CC3A64F|nr:calcium-binding allergen Ole e 8-like [Telopea speciosissima]
MTFESCSLKSSIYLEDMEELERVFNRFDAHGDGKISSTELGNVLNTLGSESSREVIHRMMREINIDEDGYIDLKEFAYFHRGSSISDADAGNGMKELKDAFDMYDKDQNRLISVNELHMVLKSLGEKCTIQDCSKMITSVDATGDGNVNFEEFKTMMTKGKA